MKKIVRRICGIAIVLLLVLCASSCKHCASKNMSYYCSGYNYCCPYPYYGVGSGYCWESKSACQSAGYYCVKCTHE